MTTSRPASFDARVMSYQPGLRRLASKLGYRGEDATDLVTDTIMFALSNWKNYRDGGGFWNWLSLNMWSIRNDQVARKKRRAHTVFHGDPSLTLASIPVAARQEEYVDAAAVVYHLTGRGGDILLRRAMGEELSEIGAGYGISRARVHQIEEKERQRVKRVVGFA